MNIVVSTVVWILLCVTFWGVIRFAFHTRRLTESIVLTAWFQLSHLVGVAKTALICRYRQLFSTRSKAESAATEESDFGDFDVAVLQAAAECGPGNTTSAPELAERFGLLPGKFERSLRKLQRDHMIDSTIGTTDGFENYRITSQGAAFASMMRKRSQADGTYAI